MLDKVSEDSIVKTLQNRYASDEIYTYIGPVLIAINPFRLIPGIYTEGKIREYRGKKFYELPPHVFALADDTYNQMINFKENQCVIISGESGSGKTETSKLIMRYISAVSGKSAKVQAVKDKMLSSNPILESFGNAKTVMNNNSSRFGKYMEILFDEGGDPQGGRVTNYLLEKARLVFPGPSERNFHIFYMLTKACSADEKEAYYLSGGGESFRYLSQSQCYDVPGINDEKEFSEMRRAFTTLGFSEDDIQDVFRTVSIVLWLGNIEFKGSGGRGEGSTIAHTDTLDVVAYLLGVDSKQLAESLTTNQIQIGKGPSAQKIRKTNNVAQAEFARDTLAKSIYSRLFDWLVLRINQSIAVDNFRGIQIGVLDIYGFEIFQHNSFEQMCINFVNEKLQQIFIELTLKAEQEEYAREGIPWKQIQYYDNKPLCQMLGGKPGVLTLLDDSCNTGKTDTMWLGDVRNYFSRNENISCGQDAFTIAHFAGNVTYQAEGFCVKNKDTLFADMILLMQSSQEGFVQAQGWKDIKVSKGQKKRPPTVGRQFRIQVNKLMKALQACTPHYIRCIKPNTTKRPKDWDLKEVRRQVQYLGLQENVKVRRAGYAYREKFLRFNSRYRVLCPAILSGKFRGTDAQCCEEICKSIGWTKSREFIMGKSKIFIQMASSLFLLEDLIERRRNEAAIVIQKAYRRFKNRKHYLILRYKIYGFVAGKKERRRASVSREYRGDYLDFRYNKLVQGLLLSNGSREDILFADRSKVAILRGKKGLFGLIKSAFVKEEQFSHRFIVLTNAAIYSFMFALDEAGKTVVKLYARVPVTQISGVTMSTLADNYAVIHFSQTARTLDIVQACRRKTELVGLIAVQYEKITGRKLPLTFSNQFTINVSLKKNKEVEITWIKDSSIPPGTQQLKLIRHNVRVHAPSGIPPSQVQPPPRFEETDKSIQVRQTLNALYDFDAKEVDELSFRAGDQLFLVEEEKDGWYRAEINGKKGYVPADYVERVQTQRPKAQPQAAQPQGTGRGRDAKAAPQAKAAKKSPWEEVQDDDGSVYYYNHETGQSQWEKPPGFGGAAAQSPATPAPQPEPQAQPEAACPWQKVVDGEDIYYYNESTGESQWEEPPGFFE